MKPVVLTALLALMLCACHRNEAATGSPPSQTAANSQAGTEIAPPTSAPTQTPTEAVVVPDNPDVNATLAELSQQLRVYVSSTRSRPKDFQDFVSRAHVQAPPPPSGKAYSISAGKVVLVNR